SSNSSYSPTTVFMFISSRFAAAHCSRAQLGFLSSTTLLILGEKAARLNGPIPYLNSGKYPIHKKRLPRVGQPLDPLHNEATTINGGRCLHLWWPRHVQKARLCPIDCLGPRR